MKPDWKDAPEWAQWLAMDSDGEWYWFENEPKAYMKSWGPQMGRSQFICGHEIEWTETKAPRP